MVETATTMEDWHALNKTLGNRLKAVAPLALPCFSLRNGHPNRPQPQACAAIQENYTEAAYRVNQFPAYVFAQSEICAPEITQQCLLDPSDPENVAAYTNVSCNQGALSSYYIQIENAQDVQAAFEFASTTNTTISIKNSGHDYNARSTGPGTLALWTRKLQNLTYHAAFIPIGCAHQAGIAAVSTGAGVNFDQAFTFAHENNATFLGGSSPTVGASGGWVMTGGHGVLSRVYGLGVDRVLEFEVATPDGQHRIANSCQNQDLFWALRGGGGSTFGVVLSTTHRVEPAAPVSVASIVMPETTPTNVSATLLELIVNSTLKWAEEGWGGYQSTATVVVVTPLLSLSAAQASMAELVAFATTHGGSATVESLSSFYEFYTQYVVPSVSAVGSALFNHNWFLPTRLFATAEGRRQVREHMDWMSSVGLTPGLLATTPYLYSGQGNSTRIKPYAYGPPNSTSANPAWRQSAVMLITEAGWAFNATLNSRKTLARTLVDASDRAKKLAPDGGAYANEAHPWVNTWQEAFWGDNYEPLLRLKQKWDPKGLLGCWHCVGSETGLASEVVGGRCLGRLI